MINFFKFSILMICFFSFSTFFTSCEKDNNSNDNAETCNVCGSTGCCDQINTESCCCL